MSSSAQEKEEEEKTPLVSITKEKVDLRKKEPPLIKLWVTNPVTYLKRWWKRVIANEGIDFRFRIRPLTAIAITLVVTSVSFGVWQVVLPFEIPFLKFVPIPSEETQPSVATPFTFRDTAFSGTLRFSIINQKFYLVTSSSEAINLEVPGNIDLGEFVGRRIFATGRYNLDTRTLFVTDAADLELLPKTVEPIPTTTPTPTPSPTLTPSPSPPPATSDVAPAGGPASPLPTSSP